MSSEDQKAEYVSRAKLSEQAERYDDMAEFMRLVTESGIGEFYRITFFYQNYWVLSIYQGLAQIGII